MSLDSFVTYLPDRSSCTRCPRTRSQHSDKADNSACGHEVFERVTADNLSDRKDSLIGQLETFRCTIRRETDDEVSGAGIAGRIQREQQHDEKQGTELHEKVEPQVAGVSNLAPIPVRNARGAHDKQWTEEPLAD